MQRAATRTAFSVGVGARMLWLVARLGVAAVAAVATVLDAWSVLTRRRPRPLDDIERARRSRARRLLDGDRLER